MLIDTHAHLNFEAFNSDRDEVIERCQKKGMSIINVGAQFETSKLAVELAEIYSNLYVAIGLHPLHVFDEEFNETDYQDLINEKVVAVGEIGFDYYHPTFEREVADSKTIEEVIKKQEEVFIKQVRFAKKNNLPVICHARNGVEGKDVYQDILKILATEKVSKAVVHFYGGDLKTAQKIVAQGYYIGIDGPVTFKKKADELQVIAKTIPLENILLETDCPWVTPEPHRGERNEPIYVELIAEKIAELKGFTKEEIIEQTYINAQKLFNF